MRVRAPFKRKSTLQRFFDTVGDQLEAATDVKPDLSGMRSRKGIKTGLIAGGGLAALTAGSAAISSLRDRIDGRRDDS
jgi:hypothetical protein